MNTFDFYQLIPLGIFILVFVLIVVRMTIKVDGLQRKLSEFYHQSRILEDSDFRLGMQVENAQHELLRIETRIDREVHRLETLLQKEKDSRDSGIKYVLTALNSLQEYIDKSLTSMKAEISKEGKENATL